MADTRGVFRLDRVRTRSVKGTWVSPDQGFASNITAPPNVGYYAGGQNPSQSPAIVSTVDKTNFDTDTTAFSPSSNLAVNHQTHGSFSSVSAGYFGGGGNPSSPGSSSQVQKLSYFSETTSIAPGSNLTQSRGYPTGCSNTQNGYFIGGYIFPTAYTTAEKLSFSTDTPYSLPSAVFTTQRYGGASAGNQSVAYFAGGLGPSGNAYDSLIDKLTYSTDTTARLPDDLTRRRVYPAGVGNADAGFFAGGVSYIGAVPGPTATVSDIDKLTYSNETVAANPSNLSVARNGIGSAGNTTSGYFGGGNPGPVATMDKITLSTGSVSAVPGAALSLPRYILAGASPRSNAFPTTGFLGNTQNLKGQPTFNFGYFMGGEPGPGPHSYAQKLDYSTETVGHVNPANLSIARSQGGQTQNKTHGFMGGGFNPPLYYNRMDKTTFASDTTVAVPGGALTAGRAYVTAAGNQNFGYFAGGSQPSVGGVYTGYDKMTYASDTTAQLPGAFMTSPKGNAGSAAGNQSRGYHGGGNPGPNSIIDKLTYNTETSSRVTTADLSISTYNRGATGNADKGYWAGGVPNVSTVEVLDYSTETRAVLPSSPLTQPRYSIGATGNSENGYFGGGTNGTPEYSLVDKINYSNNTMVRVPQADLLENAWGQGGFSSMANGLPQPRPETPTLNTSIPTGTVPNTAYFAGGNTPGGTGLNTIDKFDFTTETRLPFTNTLSIARGSSATGTSDTAGYVCTGYSYPPYVDYSRVDKITYATDNVAPVPSANIQINRQSASGASNSTATYIAGGNTPGGANNDTVEKLTFSDDTTVALPGAVLSADRPNTRSTASLDALYVIAGGPGPSPKSSVDKMKFSTETTFEVPSSALNGTRYSLLTAGNTTSGYTAGGLRYTGSYVPLSDINKITYSTDTAQLIGASLSRTVYNGGSTGNATRAYFAGGVSTVSTVDKLDYVTETTSLITPLSGARYAPAGVSGRVNGASYTSNVL